MARTGPGFVVGVLVGGLSGFAAGYLMSSNGHGHSDPSVGSIDLTPTIELKDRRPGETPQDVAEAPNEKPA